MKERVLRTEYADFVAAEWDGGNASGYLPVNDKVIVLMDAPRTKAGSIHLTDEYTERQQLGAVSGVIVAVGPSAFRFNADRTLEWTGARPEAGTRVCIERYAGQILKGHDGKTYRILDDRSVAAVETPMADAA